MPVWNMSFKIKSNESFQSIFAISWILSWILQKKKKDSFPGGALISLGTSIVFEYNCFEQRESYLLLQDFWKFLRVPIWVSPRFPEAICSTYVTNVV